MTAFIVAARRTAVMPRGGVFAALSIHSLAAPVIAACLADAGMAKGQVDEVIVSNALGAGGNPARVVGLAAGLEVAGLSLDRQCAGGLDALWLARALIVSGQTEVVLAGGVESYSRRPLRLCTDPLGGPPVAYDQPPFTPWPDRDPDMAKAADALGRSHGITRAAQDDWAVASHARALAARDRLRAEIVPLPGVGGTGDGFTRALTQRLAARAPVVTGTITAANAAVAADAAAFCLVVSERIARGMARAMRIVGGATVGGDVMLPGLAPVAAIARALNGVSVSALTAAEIMEAYAVQAITCVQGAGIDPAVVNLGGGALARGHPIGASGAILAVRMFHELRHGYGVAAIAAAGGIGSALVLEG